MAGIESVGGTRSLEEIPRRGVLALSMLQSHSERDGVWRGEQPAQVVWAGVLTLPQSLGPLNDQHTQARSTCLESRRLVEKVEVREVGAQGRGSSLDGGKCKFSAVPSDAGRCISPCHRSGVLCTPGGHQPTPASHQP